MNENLIKLLNSLQENNELADKMKACASPDEAYAFACTIVDGYTQEEFVACMTKIKNENSNSNELTEEDLDQVSGGLSQDEWIAMGSLGIAVAGAAGSAV